MNRHIKCILSFCRHGIKILPYSHSERSKVGLIIGINGFFINDRPNKYFVKEFSSLWKNLKPEVKRRVRPELIVYPSKILRPDARGFRALHRRPLKVIRHDIKGSTLEEYLEETIAQDGSIRSEKEGTAEELEESPASENLFSKKTIQGSSAQQLEIKKKKTISSSVKKKFNQSSEHPHRKKVPSSAKEPQNAISSESEEEHGKVLKDLHVHLYETASRKIKSLFEYGKSSHLRQKHDVFTVEGWRLVAEGLACGLKPHAIFFSRSRLFMNMVPQVAGNEDELVSFLNMFPIYRTRYATLKLWSSLVTPPGIIAAFPLSAAVGMCETPREKSFPVTVILDQIRDPNNLGSIMRTLAAACVEKVICIKGCCDIWDSKVLRTSCGANFYMHCVTRASWETVDTFLPSRHSIFLADACHETPEEEETTQNANSNLMQLDTLRDMALTESENQKTYFVNVKGEKVIINRSYTDPEHMKHFKHLNLPQFSYRDSNLSFFEMDGCDNQSVVLILGGETGLSSCAKKFALENGGVQVSIPMAKGIDSLNSSVATGILVFEMQRQYEKLIKLDVTSRKDDDKSV